ncbi:MAG TPA: transglycosylase SLT domain-containing protein [Candidatus Acidoferrales bacterium]|nr:transglycosylase SLT domain-containing protein [Candidatus Acidoferrales bacterium]
MANAKSSGVEGARAALALGYFDYSRQHYADAAKWFDRAKSDPLLGDYALYWRGQNEFAQQHSTQAVAEMQEFRKTYPDSVMTEQALQILAEAAMAANQPAVAIEALDGYALTPERPALLLLRGEAHEAAQQPAQAAADYLSIYTHYPVSNQGKEAWNKLDFLRGSLGNQIPAIPIETRLAHVESIFNDRQWSEARTQYSEILPELTGTSRERAEVRIMECGVALGAGTTELGAMQISDPDVDAERDYAVADYYRALQDDTHMKQAVEAAASRAPSSVWADNALFLAGNYYWVNLDRDQASSFYWRDEQQFPTSSHAAAAQWRVAWTAVLKRDPAATELLTEHLRRFPGSLFTPDALYWLGRLAEKADEKDLARSYYAKLAERYPGNFFDMAAAERRAHLGPGPTAVVDVLATIPAIPPAAAVSDTIPAAAAHWQARADALRSIAFDSSADLELRAAYAATGEPKLLVEAAQADVAAKKFGAAIVTLRTVYPQLEYRAYDTVPRAVWEAAYPLPDKSSILRWSAHNKLDPMLIAGLSRQESAFDPDAVSDADAYGLMQLLPETGRKWARQQHVRYSLSRLLEADYNVRLGTAYFAWLKQTFGSVEAALAGYNAGEDRITQWTTTPYRDVPEFVDSIPFTETREYVEIITRNASIYHRLYSAPSKSVAKTLPAKASAPKAAKSAPKSASKSNPYRKAGDAAVLTIQ